MKSGAFRLILTAAVWCLLAIVGAAAQTTARNRTSAPFSATVWNIAVAGIFPHQYAQIGPAAQIDPGSNDQTRLFGN